MPAWQSPIRRWPAWRWWHSSALALALAAAAALVFTGADPAPRGLPPGPLTVARAWPDARVADTPGKLPDGTPFTPLHHLDANTAVGTAISTRDRLIRLVLRGDDGVVRDLRRLSNAANPQFTGFAAAGDQLVWAESTTNAGGHGETRLWRVNWRSGDEPQVLTADVGDAVFFNSEYDLVIADARVHWVAVGRTATPTTEVRSIPLSGGSVGVQSVDGAYSLVAWPWLASANGSQGAVILHSLADGRQRVVPAPPTELLACSPAWCRVLLTATGAGAARIEVMHLDGTDRQKVATGQVSAAINDVAVLDRFEVLTVAGPGTAAINGQQLLLYDTNAKRTVVVADRAGMVLCRAGLLWWSTGDPETLSWHTLDLRTLR